MTASPVSPIRLSSLWGCSRDFGDLRDSLGSQRAGVLARPHLSHSRGKRVSAVREDDAAPDDSANAYTGLRRRHTAREYHRTSGSL